MSCSEKTLSQETTKVWHAEHVKLDGKIGLGLGMNGLSQIVRMRCLAPRLNNV